MPIKNPISELTKAAPLWLVGCGKMGGALLEGWLAKGLNPEAVIVIDPCGHETCPKAIPAANCYDNVLTIEGGISPYMIVLAIKPQNIDSILNALKTVSLDNALVISIAAGTRIESMAKDLPKKTAIIRAMPNTPAAIKKGITALVKNKHAKPDDEAMAGAMFDACGEVVWLEDESQFDAVTALSGSGPAYIFHLLEAMTEAGVELGLDAEIAEKFARQTIVGAAGLLEESTLSAAELRENVTSPNGTTEAALNVLMADDGLVKLMTKAMTSARDRGVALSGKN